jgi:DNA repair protein RecO (recombination protein O)
MQWGSIGKADGLAMSIEWTDAGVVLGSRSHGEKHAIVELFTRENGRAAALMYGGASTRGRPVLQSGNLVTARFKARTETQLGFFSPCELDTAFAARFMDDAAALAGLASAVALVRKATAERQAYSGIFDALVVLLDALNAPDVWPAIYTRFELGLLAALGYGLDLTACALTGSTEDLAFVSPRSGRAASAEAGAPFADKLLRLPPFIADPSAALAPGDVADAFALSGWFLERRVFDARGEGVPDARRRLIETLGYRGML